MPLVVSANRLFVESRAVDMRRIIFNNSEIEYETKIDDRFKPKNRNILKESKLCVRHRYQQCHPHQMPPYPSHVMDENMEFIPSAARL